MPNGDRSQPTGPEVDALKRRSSLLATKVSSLEENRFSRDEAMAILFADIEAGLTEFGTPTLASTQLGGSTTVPEPRFDMATLVGAWAINPSLEEACHAALRPSAAFSLNAVTLEVSLIDQGQTRGALIFRDDTGIATRATGTLTPVGGTAFEFLGTFDESQVRLRVSGTFNEGKLQATLRFEYRGTPLDFGVFSPCRDSSHSRVLEKQA